MSGAESKEQRAESREKGGEGARHAGTPLFSLLSALCSHLPERLAALTGWRRALVAALLGILLAAALPPIYVLPAAVVALTGFVWLLDGAAGWRRGFLDGWAFGAGFSLAGFYWIANALLVFADRFGWMYPFALVLIAAGFGLFTAVGAAVARPFPRGFSRVLAFGLAWLVLEWVRSWLFTGFPWNLLGTCFAIATPLMQTAAWGGPWLLSALMLVVALAPAPAAYALPGHGRRCFAGGLAVSVLLVAALYGIGAWRLAEHPTRFDHGIRLRLVQPDIAESEKWSPQLEESHFATQIHLSLSQSAVAPPDAVIWPEAAIPPRLLRDPAHRAEAASVLAPGALLLTGAVRIDRGPNGNLRPWNSLVAINDKGAIIAHYDKHHLVPFGEYVPLRGLLPISKLTPGEVDFAAGPGPVLLKLGKLPPFRPLICYEVIFPAEIAPPGMHPAWLLNITNDAWYGVSTGPYQHFVAARMRAVEQGVPLVRVANTGISGLVDPLGRVLARLPLMARGSLNVTLPKPLEGLTPYARWSDLTLLLSVVPGLLVLAWSLRRTRRAGGGR